ncbi:MAG: glycine--tRNA ligase subunit alpha [Candidatus Omnitrophica bacterium CG1_02_46_14]|nr:MAG: glycine--tRNA ligase subunit alpha [Candidatus Omnitrophica bacterium CG1_02_46_14]
MYFQDLILKLSDYWAKQGCTLLQPYDIEVGAGTFHPATFFGSLGPESWKVAYVQPTRRPTDGRYGENPLRTQHYYQYQVILKPSPENAQDLYLDSLRAVGLKLEEHDVRFVQDDWESPTLGASGLGWEVWFDSLEVTQFTYFQQMAGFGLSPISCEITYGLERLCMFLQNKRDLFDLQWSKDLKYGDLRKKYEVEYCRYNFETSDARMLHLLFETYESEAKRLLGPLPSAEALVLPAYEWTLKTSHLFNMLDARGAVSVNERPAMIARVRALAKKCAQSYFLQKYPETVVLNPALAKGVSK